MIELKQDLWEMEADARVITTNGFVKRNGDAVMGRGCALEAKRVLPGIERFLGRQLRMEGNRVHFLIHHDSYGDVYSFPVKHHWKETADLTLITQSAKEILELSDSAGYDKVIIPRPGCGNGNLEWKEVNEVLKNILDDRFIVVYI